MKVQFYFVRHGETLFNLKSRIQGICDSPLTEKGVNQANVAALALEDVFFHKAFTSPSERCMNTAKAILKNRYMKAEILDDLHEYDFGRLEGSRFTSHTEEVRHCFALRDFSSVNGDSPESVSFRIRRAFETMTSQCDDGDNILVVSHGFYEFFVLNVLLGIDIDQYQNSCEKSGKNPIPNAGILKFTYENGKYQLVQLPTDPYIFKEEISHKQIHFYYVRHGQTLFNVWNRMQGASGSPLTDLGRDQAMEARNVLDTIHFSYAFVSSTQRTRETASIILNGKDTKVFTTQALKEVNFGEFEGVVTDSWEKEIIERHKNHENWTDVGGENTEMVKQRMMHILYKSISAAKDGDNILLVSHGTYYLTMLEVLFGLDRDTVATELRKKGKSLMPNGGIFRFDFDGSQFQFVSFMETPKDFSHE